MNTLFPHKKLVIASHNAGKVVEIQELLTPFGLSVHSAAELDLPEPEETGDTFEANALLKARSAFDHAGLPALADDSGLVVDGLDGAPGIYSARWAGPEKDFDLAMEKVRTALEERYPDAAEPHAAHFVCSLALVYGDGAHQIFTGKVYGTLTFPPRGTMGFGYDPIFTPKDHHVTFAEMEPKRKHAISHRADAFRQLVEWLKTRAQGHAA